MAVSSTGSSTGTASTIDVAGIVSQLMQVEQKPLAALDTKEAAFQAKITAYGSIRSAVSTFQAAVKSLNSSTAFSTNAATSSDTTVMDASASATAAIGTHAIEVTKLAQTQKLEAIGKSNTVTTIGSGTLTFDFGTITDATTPTFDPVTGKYGAGVEFDSNNAPVTVTIDSNNNSLQGISDAINNAHIGVTASIVNDGSSAPYRLVLSSNTSGKAGSVKITVNGDQALTDLLGYDPTGTQPQNMSQIAVGQNAELKVDGVSISKTTNQVSDVLDGVTLNLHKVGSASLTVIRDSTSVKNSVQSFVTAYNDLNKTISSLTAYNATTKKGGVLIGDSTVRLIQSQINNMLATPIGGLNRAMTSLFQVGITMQKDGSLALDLNKLQSAIDTYPNDIAGLFTAVGKPSDNQISFLSSSANTRVGIYALNVTNLGLNGGTATGSLGGAVADGGGQTLTGAVGTGASGLQVQIMGGSTGDRGTVSFTRGYADQLDSLLNTFLASNGEVATSINSLNQRVKNISSQRDALNQRLADKQAQYTKQFSALNAMLSSMQQTSDSLAQQFASLANLNKQIASK